MKEKRTKWSLLVDGDIMENALSTVHSLPSTTRSSNEFIISDRHEKVVDQRSI